MSDRANVPLDSSTILSSEALAELRKFPSPTIVNAVETFDVRPRGEGFTDSRIRCLFPELGTVVAYACTAAIISDKPAPKVRRASRTDYWRYVQSAPGPKIVVVEDIGESPLGAYWGEVNANMHVALGALGVLTNGTVRDLAEVQSARFHFFASGVSVSHGFAHLEDFNIPVKVFGMTVKPGDLIHADRHGAVVIPHEVAPHVAEACRKIESAERVMLDLCQSPSFSIEQLDPLISPEY